MSQKRMIKLRKKRKENPEIYEQFLAKERIRDRERREKNKLKLRENATALQQQRLKINQRVKKHRQIKKLAKNAISLAKLGTYSCKQTLGKAVKKVKKSLPESPRKKVAVVKRLIEDIIPSEQRKIFLEKVKKKPIKIFSEESKIAVIEFYLADKNSWQSPHKRDVVTTTNLSTGKKDKIAKRYLVVSVSELYELFKTAHPEVDVKKTKFFELRPLHVKTRKNTPHNICTCIYHENFTNLIRSLSEKIPNFPPKLREVVQKLCCDVNSEACMRGTSKSCPTVGSLISEDIIGDQIVHYKQWIFSKDEKRLFQKKVSEKLIEAINSLDEKASDFKIHYYINKVQSAHFEQAIKNVSAGQVVLQVDYAEKYSLKFQDEAQSAYYNRKLVTIFTCCAWLNGTKKCLAVLSDLREQNKYTVWFCLKIILENLKKSIKDLKEVEIFSDGAGSQFKNRHTLSNLVYCLHEFNLKLTWNFTATSHGKGAVDGIGAVLKQSWWLAVKSRQEIFGGAKDCHEYAEKKF